MSVFDYEPVTFGPLDIAELADDLADHLDACREHLVAVTNDEQDNPAIAEDPSLSGRFDDTSAAIAAEVLLLLLAHHT